MGQVRDPAFILQIFERIKRRLNVEITTDETTNTMTCRIPGFKYDDFDRAAFVNLVKCLRMMEMNRTLLEEVFNMNVAFYVIGDYVQASKKLYKAAALDFPMKFNSYESKVGKTSIDLVQSLAEEKTNEVVVQRVLRLVNVDPRTNTAVPIPDDIRSALLKKLNNTENLQLPRFEIPALPERHFVHDLRIRFADLDLVFHVNQNNYVQFALECAAQAASEGFYSKIRGDICFYPVKTSSGMYFGESLAGDILRICTWEDESNPMLLYFVMKKNDRNICHEKIEFFDSVDFAVSKL